MKLTRRQEEFIESLIDLSQELDGAVHYSVLAERLGVSPYTAYDMLCLLEEKGMVASEYQVAEGRSGPGRAERLFFPLNHRNRGLAGRFEAISPGVEEWKQGVLSHIREEDGAETRFAKELLALIPSNGPAEIRFCLEVMVVLASYLSRHSGRQEFVEYLSHILPNSSEVSPVHLCLLGGFAVGFLVQEEMQGREWLHGLLGRILQYQDIVRRLTPHECRLLADDLIAIFSALAADPDQTVQGPGASASPPGAQGLE